MITHVTRIFILLGIMVGSYFIIVLEFLRTPEGVSAPSSAPDVSSMRMGTNPADWYTRRHTHAFRRADTAPTLPGQNLTSASEACRSS
jgi:hypothetical protein